ncbi:MAG: GntR family transcriptional regulator [Loktanella sp.]|nr:GntR family transcriptional regulator [Loktanella sp.]
MDNSGNLRDAFGTVPHIAPRRSLADEAANRLRDLILLERLAPGTPVSERELADVLGISRTPLKDALRILEAEGLVDYGPTRRPRVADPSIDELRDYITVLGALEALAGEIACSEATAEELEVIERMAAQMDTGPDDPLAFFHLDMAFHGAIVAAAHNAPLAETHRQYNARLWRARFLSSRQVDRRANTLSEHGRIVAALNARDAAQTSAALRDHLRSAVDNVARIRMAAHKTKSKGKT